MKQNPYIGFGKDSSSQEWKLRLALNTDQYGRTFEVTLLIVAVLVSLCIIIVGSQPHVPHCSPSAVRECRAPHYQSQRARQARCVYYSTSYSLFSLIAMLGNIVQAYPAVEYDFVPNQLIVNVGDFIHFQWTGCDTNPNYAGEGSNAVILSTGGINMGRHAGYGP